MPPFRNARYRRGGSQSTARFLESLPAVSFESPANSSVLSSPISYASSSTSSPMVSPSASPSPAVAMSRHEDDPPPPIQPQSNPPVPTSSSGQPLPAHLAAFIALPRLPAPAVASTSALPSAGGQQQTLQQIMAYVDENGNENTAKTYRGYMQEFVEWTEEQLHYDTLTRRLVTEEKVILFLHNQVVGRETRVRRRNAAPGVRQEISGQTVMMYVAAIMKLYEMQVRANANANPSPRGRNLKDYLKWVKADNHERGRRNKIDRAVRTVRDGYSNLEGFKAICNEFLKSGRSVYLRDRASFLLMHFGLWRSESARMLEFGDIDIVDLANEGPMPCKAVMFRLEQGKTNQMGHLQYTSAIRGKHVEMCAIGATAMWLFQRFHRNNEPFPNLDNREWFQIKVICNVRGDNTVQCSADSQSKGISAVKTRLGLESSHILHMNRGSGAAMAELSGAHVDHIRRHGHWNRQALENVYLTNIPRQAVRALAAFPPDHPSFFIQRAIRQPPQELQDMVFPELNQYLNPDFPWTDRTMTTSGFIDFMKFLRIVFLQDCVEMRQLHPGLSIWDDPIFETPIYLTWETEMRQEVEVAVPPADVRLRELMPELLTRLDEQHQSVSARLTSMENQQGQLVANHAQMRDDILGHLGETVNGTISSVFQDISLRFGTTGSNIASSSASVPLVANTTTNTPTFQDLVPAMPAQPVAGPPVYKMNRNISTASDTWREYRTGIGGPAIRALEEAWGARWRKGHESRFFNRRKPLYDWMKSQIANGGDPTQLIIALDTWIQAPNASLNRLCAHLKAGHGPNDLLSEVQDGEAVEEQAEED